MYYVLHFTETVTETGWSYISITWPLTNGYPHNGGRTNYNAGLFDSKTHAIYISYLLNQSPNLTYLY